MVFKWGQLLVTVKGTTINDLGVGSEEIEKKTFLRVHVREKISMYIVLRDEIKSWGKIAL